MRLFTRDTKVEALRRAPLFEGLSRKELIELARVTEDLEFEAGQVLTREGEPGREFFVIMEGEAEVLKGGEAVASLGSGDFFGEIALVEDVPRTATVRARSPLRVFLMSRQSFVPLLDDHAGVERKILRALARRVANLSAEHL